RLCHPPFFPQRVFFKGKKKFFFSRRADENKNANNDEGAGDPFISEDCSVIVFFGYIYSLPIFASARFCCQSRKEVNGAIAKRSFLLYASCWPLIVWNGLLLGSCSILSCGHGNVGPEVIFLRSFIPIPEESTCISVAYEDNFYPRFPVRSRM